MDLCVIKNATHERIYRQKLDYMFGLQIKHKRNNTHTLWNTFNNDGLFERA